jgi:hypothetical protein
MSQLSHVLGELSPDRRQLAADRRQLSHVVSRLADNVAEIAAAFSLKNPVVLRWRASLRMVREGGVVLSEIRSTLADDRCPVAHALE